MNFLALDGEEYNYILETISNLQLVFHPKYSKDGQIDYNELMNIKYYKKVIVLLDRNLLSSLLKLSREGILKDEKEMRIIALLMTWILMNHFPASAGFALKEYANKTQKSYDAKLELQEFNNIFEYYPSMIWLRLAEGDIDRIPKCNFQVKPFITEIDYAEKDDHFLIHIAEMLHVVYLLRKENMSPVEKIIDFLKWDYSNLLISESTIAYVAMLLTNQNGIKAPKKSGSNDIDKILEGCKNQAWDLNYLTNWSCFHYDEEKLNDIFLFATNDNMLKTIFINTYADGGIGALIKSVFSKKDTKKIFSLINSNQGNKRIKPDFGENPKNYFNNLIEDEKRKLTIIL